MLYLGQHKKRKEDHDEVLPFTIKFYNSMRPHRKLHNLSPDGFEDRLGLNGI